MNNSISGMEDLEANNFNSSIIQDNKIVFILDEVSYRVRMPNQGEQSLLEHKKNLAQIQFISEPGCISQRELIKKLKDNNVLDIEKLEEEKDILLKELKMLWILLAEKDSSNVEGVNKTIDRVGQVKAKIKECDLESSNALTPSLQSRLEKFYIENISIICTEILEDGEWRILWSDIEQFNAGELNLTNTATANMTWLLLNRGR